MSNGVARKKKTRKSTSTISTWTRFPKRISTKCWQKLIRWMWQQIEGLMCRLPNST